MFYYLYKITNLINNKVYIGVHQTSKLEDGYFGSGININRAINKYGKENFNKEILEFFNTEEDMLSKEKEIVNPEFLKLDHVYNINEGGKGSFTYINSLPNQGHKPGQQRIASQIAADKLKYDLEHRAKFSKKMSIANKKRAELGNMFWQQPGFVNPAITHRWLSNDDQSKSLYVHQDQINSYIEAGWYMGRKYKKTSLGTKYKKRT